LGRFPRLPVGSGLLLTGAGLFLLVSGVLVPSFLVYWGVNPRGSGGTYASSLQPGQDYSERLQGGPPTTFTVVVSASGPVHVELVPLGQDISSQDWGVGTHFSKKFTIMEGDWVVRANNPSSNDAVEFEIGVSAEPGPGYPLPFLSKTFSYMVVLVLVGVVLVGLGTTGLRRDAYTLFGLRGEKGFWTCFSLPGLYLLDAAITFASIHSFGLAVESNAVVFSLYVTGWWAVLFFHIATSVLLAGLSFLMYWLIVGARLPALSRRVVVVLFSTIFGAIGFPVLFGSRSLLLLLFPDVSEYLVPSFFFAVGASILLSSILATYLSTILPDEDLRLSD